MRFSRAPNTCNAKALFAKEGTMWAKIAAVPNRRATHYPGHTGEALSKPKEHDMSTNASVLIDVV